jgi:alkanesulfonate monooxygenase SsuD/methylene tetrahydromethanopterin reductase-like flavin-dependent oxidoreductase (luciferase family)
MAGTGAAIRADKELTVGARHVRFDMQVFQELPWPVMCEEMRYLEALDIGTLWLRDHYAWPPRPTAPVLEAWATLAALAARPSRLRLGTLVSDVALRHPALLAKQAATVDCISGGRLDLGLGPGYFEREFTWLGIPFLTPGGRIDRLREAVEVIDGLLRDRLRSYHGTYYHLEEAPLAPAPVQRPRPPLVIAANGTRALQVVAAYADVWVSFGPEGATMEASLARIREHNHLLDDYCLMLDRAPERVERAYLVGWAEGAPFASADAFQDFVGRYREAGIRRFIFVFASAASPYDEARAAGIFAGRAALDTFGAQAMMVMGGRGD